MYGFKAIIYLDSWLNGNRPCMLRIKYFSNIKIINIIHIHFPNGKTLTTYFSGTIHFDKYLQLDGVLYIPEFKFSLITISKLCKNLQYQIYFSQNSCQVQNVSTQRKIGKMAQHNNL